MMNDLLAQELLAKTTGWGTEKLTEERKDLQLLAQYKYDGYQQFEPGMRFIESLARWLGQFEESSRDVAYDFIKNNLLYISEAEMNHIIRLVYPDFVRRLLMKRFAADMDIKEHKVRKISRDDRFRIREHQCLFLGLSDGARIDALRRFSGLRHEQTHPTYTVTEETATSMLDDLQCVLSDKGAPGDAKYKYVFLVDDFSASGQSYLRCKDGGPGGKIARFNDERQNGRLKDICEDEAQVYVVLYVATKRAKNHILRIARESKIKIDDVIVIVELDDATCMTEEGLGDFAPLAEEKLDPSIITKYYKVGRHDKPHMGFDECGLPVVLGHNCPNNSLPIIWCESKFARCRALFPRVERHKV